jgi:hypothetical protein
MMTKKKDSAETAPRRPYGIFAEQLADNIQPKRRSVLFWKVCAVKTA